GHADRMKDHRILVVDDEPASRKGLQELLTVWGYDVSSAADGQEALERAAVRAPDLVIADLVMAGIDGLELLTRLKCDFPTSAGGDRSSRATARRFPRRCWTARSSATSVARSPAPSSGVRAVSSWPTAAPSSSTKSPRCSRVPRPSSSACSRRGSSVGWAPRPRSA